MKMIRRLVIVVTVLLVLITVLAVTAAAEEIGSGTCGENLTWVLDDSGTLTISGTGLMDSWASSSRTPWARIKNSIEKIVIENGATSIGNYGFYGCVNLQSVIVPEGITSIGKCVFYNCENLQSITIPQSVNSIGFSAFSRCKGLQNINIPNGVTVIEKSLFQECTGLQKIAIPNTITTIGYGAFYGCTSLKDVTVPDSVASIDGYAFHGCSGLENIILGKGVTGIGDAAFRFCTGVEEVTIPDGVTDIVYATFAGCTGLQNILIPDSVTKIGNAAFDECDGLSTVCYSGTKEQKNKISISEQNSPLLNANWKYEMKEIISYFADIQKTSWQYQSARYACDRGLMAGKGTGVYGNIKFDPNSAISREEFVQVLYNSQGKPSVSVINKFPDVGETAWYKNAVLWANENNIANGTGAGIFGTGQNISRQDLAMMLYKFAKLKRCDLSLNEEGIARFADRNQIAKYAETAMNWAVTHGVLKGKGNLGAAIIYLDPTGTATRAECAAMLKNFMEAFGL